MGILQHRDDLRLLAVGAGAPLLELCWLSNLCNLPQISEFHGVGCETRQ